MEDFPPLVIQANALARQVGFALTREEAGSDCTTPSCCLPGVGRLLAVLAASCHAGRIGEIGTGVGRRERTDAPCAPVDLLFADGGWPRPRSSCPTCANSLLIGTQLT